MKQWVKQAITVGGAGLALPGLLLMVFSAPLMLIMALDGDAYTAGMSLASLTLVLLSLGAGGLTAWHGLRSLRGRVSGPLRLPPIWLMAGIFALLVILGRFTYHHNFLGTMVFPALLWGAALLPPLMAVSWFAGADGGPSRRRGLVALAGGATVSVVIAIALEILFPAVIMALVFNLADLAQAGLESLFEALSNAEIAQAVTNPAFIFIFVQVALIAPLAEEFAKPLVVLPVIGRLSKRETFLVGALAGAGFAAVENVLYAGFGVELWAGILLVRAVGGAVHPVGAGLMALGWRAVIRGESGAGIIWLKQFMLAAGLHALWNGGSLIVITLGGAQFFGDLPPKINVLGLSAGGATLALLVILGLAGLWLGRSVAEQVTEKPTGAGEASADSFVMSNRAAAIWGLACLAAIVPAGITGLQLLVG